jgi:glycosyltransferase involved in cell wall biosynthesis
MAVVSVVTPVYNGERYLRECIESVLAQSYSDWEYVIVDNCSSDGSRAIAESYLKDKRIRIYHNDHILPVVESFNRAASLISPDAKYLKFISSDDLLFRNCLEMMVDVAEPHEKIRLVSSYKVHGKYPVFDGPPFPDTVMPGKEVCKSFFQGRLGLLGSETNHMIRLPVELIEGKLFDDKFEKHSDTELFLRMLKNNEDMGFVHQVLTFTREHDASVSARESHMLGTSHLEYLGMLLKHGSDFLSDNDRRSLMRAYRQRYHRFLFRAMLKVWDRRIWDYHKRSCRKLGLQVSLFGILGNGIIEMATSSLHPLHTTKKMRNEYSRMKSRKSIQ